MSDQSAATIATLLVEEIVGSHGVLKETFRDQGKASMSGLMIEVKRGAITIIITPPLTRWQKLLKGEETGISTCSMDCLPIEQ